ncbi:MAG TPA: histidine kinase [Opitutaceae bacterium]
MPSPAVSSSHARPGDEPAAARRARERLYALCQVGGWGGFMLVQLFVLNALSKSGVGPWYLAVQASTLGLLLTHFARTQVIHRRGWQRLGWKALLPRTAALVALIALAWCALSYVAAYQVSGFNTKNTLPLPLQLIVGYVNCCVLLIPWFSFYFFYSIYHRTHRLELDQAKFAAAAKDAELRALKSQINPHFIFNSLNSLRALIDENPAQARQSVTQLANLLRYSLQSAQAETVAFEDELRVVNDYLALEQVRHEERLRVRLDIAPDTLGLAVPPLLLQTLVENAVKYGISTRPEGGEIAITARCVDGQLQLSVTNPGELRPASQRPASSSTGLGLKNAAERLRAFFGERARLELRAATDSLVVAEVSIPMQPLRA